MRTLRNAITFATPIAGMVMVLAAVLVVVSPQAKLALVVLGLLLVEGGVWRLAGSVLPNERRYLALRAESNRFVAMVRQLNSAAIAVRQLETPGARMALEETKRAMHRSVDRMVAVAGRTSEEVPADAPIELPDGEGPAISGESSSAMAASGSSGASAASSGE
jgi:enoyl-CoA hydratase/carnithine racemase